MFPRDPVSAAQRLLSSEQIEWRVDVDGPFFGYYDGAALVADECILLHNDGTPCDV
jgi:uncharacterized lipoprotein YmbA